MKKMPLGCLSLSGSAAAGMTLLLLLALGLVQGGQMFSPGDLNAQAGSQRLGGVISHAETGGRCSACHTAPWQTGGMSDLCLDCHQELVTKAEDFHQVMLAQARLGACYDCHTDHRGAFAPLTLLDLQDFPHLLVGFSLQGHPRNARGEAFTCQECHTQGVTVFELAACQDCHTQIDAAYTRQHAQDFGAGCLDCHDGVDRYGSDFDHNQLAFKLEGGHAEAACAACHAGARSASELQNTRQECTSCHAQDDAHQGQFGSQCESCHSVDNWQDASFDHDLSAFPLTGAHIGVECESCHTGGVFKGTPVECSACHAEPELHLGLFPADCAACHSTSAWSPAAYEEPHPFPMDHGEAGVSSCQTCHPDNLRQYTCYGCHEHTPQGIAEKHTEEGIANFEDCMECHPTGEEDKGEGD